MKNILITGGCGFVGTNLAVFLKSKKFVVNTLDNFIGKDQEYNYKILKDNKIKNFNIDITNLKRILNLPKYDLIIDCCAEAAVEVSKNEIDRVFNTNLVGTLNILKKVRKDKSKIIFLSTSRVYPLRDLNNLVKNKNIKKKINLKKKFNEKTIFKDLKAYMVLQN
jgi:CDP-paratose 2-epimerase